MVKPLGDFDPEYPTEAEPVCMDCLEEYEKHSGNAKRKLKKEEREAKTKAKA